MEGLIEYESTREIHQHIRIPNIRSRWTRLQTKFDMVESPEIQFHDA